MSIQSKKDEMPNFVNIIDHSIMMNNGQSLMNYLKNRVEQEARSTYHSLQEKMLCKTRTF